MRTKSTRKRPAKAMRLKDLSGKGKEIRGGGKIKFNE